MWDENKGEAIIVNVEDLTLSELKKLKLMDKKQEIVTLDEFLEEFRNSDLILCLELKSNKEITVKKTLDMIKKKQIKTKFLIYSF